MANEQALAGPTAGAPSKGVIWVSRVLSAIPVLMMGFGGIMKILRNPMVLADWSTRFGYPDGALVPIGVAELACAVLYIIPRTSVLGAILVAGYLGGATATHVRVSEGAFVAPAVLGILAWAGLYLREPRLRALLPLRRDG
ncbi:MAG TPA: DoxX family protein [Anaeromyxobacteraceae bacterium]|nr:DoxX family protein [Anaeromyxobacteraceae bacterium]